MKLRPQFSLQSLLAVTLFTALLAAALCGVFGPRIERIVGEFSVFMALAAAWSAIQVIFYTLIVAPLILVWLIAQRLRVSAAAAPISEEETA